MLGSVELVPGDAMIRTCCVLVWGLRFFFRPCRGSPCTQFVSWFYQIQSSAPWACNNGCCSHPPFFFFNTSPPPPKYILLYFTWAGRKGPFSFLVGSDLETNELVNIRDRGVRVCLPAWVGRRVVPSPEMSWGFIDQMHRMHLPMEILSFPWPPASPCSHVELL